MTSLDMIYCLRMCKEAKSAKIKLCESTRCLCKSKSKNKRKVVELVMLIQPGRLYSQLIEVGITTATPF